MQEEKVGMREHGIAGTGQVLEKGGTRLAGKREERGEQVLI